MFSFKNENAIRFEGVPARPLGGGGQKSYLLFLP